MKQYLDLLDRILRRGVRKENRTGTDTLAVFGHQMRFCLSDGFPLITTKKVHTKSVLYELLWMLNGDTNVEFLQKNGVKIWNEWAKADFRPELGHPEGELGPVYGKQWREWEGPTSVQKQDDDNVLLVRPMIDQIDQIVEKLIHKPDDRRNILSSWNVGRIHKMKLPPCHCFCQFDVTEGRLSCHMYIRSWDVFLGGPFNIAQYAFLTHVLAHTTRPTKNPLQVGDLVISSGDTHLYVNQLDQAREQLSREPRALPRLKIDARDQDARSRRHGMEREGKQYEPEPFQYEDFVLEGYDPHPHIKADVAV